MSPASLFFVRLPEVSADEEKYFYLGVLWAISAES